MDQLQSIVERLEKVAVKFEGIKVGQASIIAVGVPGGASTNETSAAGAPTEAVSAGESSSAFQKVLDDHMTKILHAAGKMGRQGAVWTSENQNKIVEATDLFKSAFEAEKNVVDALSQCRKPSQPEMQKLVQPVVNCMTAAAEKTQGRRTELFNHFSFVSECLNSLTWVVLEGEGAEKPPLHIKQCVQSAEFYSNKILKEFRVTDVSHVEWVNGIKSMILAMSTYCSTYHMKAPTWNPDGISVSEFLGSDPPVESAAPPAAEPKKTPAPKVKKPEFPESKPMGPPQVHPTRSWQPQVDKPNPAHLVADVFDAKKKGLKKVTDAEKAKNIPGRSGLVPVKLRSTGAPTVKAGKTELVMERKWTVENHKGNKEIVLENTNPRQTVYIYKCEDSVVKVDGKVNAITVDSCKKLGLLFETVMASVEVVNSSAVDVQATGHIGTLAVDKCDGVKVYIPDSSTDVAISTAKSAGVLVIVTGGEEPAESAVPDQFVSVFEEGKLITRPAEHAGA
ncbi:hypothetical protein BSKO_13214 [Bryopsis sp. KO-2023]|nr:hypothetical protein BSKO_13214 [Bryopsis sp. KO-2023]